MGLRNWNYLGWVEKLLSTVEISDMNLLGLDFPGCAYLHQDIKATSRTQNCRFMATAFVAILVPLSWMYASVANSSRQPLWTLCSETLEKHREQHRNWRWVEASEGTYYLHKLFLPLFALLGNLLSSPLSRGYIISSTSWPVLFPASSLCLAMSFWAELLLNTSPNRSHLAEKRWNDCHFRENKSCELEV